MPRANAQTGYSNRLREIANAQTGYSNRLREILFRAAQAGIGQELKAYYRPPPELPRDMFMLLMKLKEEPERTASHGHK
jgi:hypothetical protein